MLCLLLSFFAGELGCCSEVWAAAEDISIEAAGVFFVYGPKLFGCDLWHFNSCIYHLLCVSLRERVERVVLYLRFY